MLKKIFLGMIALFFIFIGGVWLLFSYVKSHPDSVMQSIEKMVQHFTAGQAYEEKSEDSLFEIQDILIRSGQSPIEIIASDRPSLEILYSGKVPKAESGPFIIRHTEGVKLGIVLKEPMSSHLFQMNINGQDMARSSDVALKAQIFLPKKFHGALRIETESASVEMKAATNHAYEFYLQSARGTVENLVAPPSGVLNPSEVTSIHILTTSGTISIKPE